MDRFPVQEVFHVHIPEGGDGVGGGVIDAGQYPHPGRGLPGDLDYLPDGLAWYWGHGYDDLIDIVLFHQAGDAASLAQYGHFHYEAASFAGVVIDKAHYFSFQGLILLKFF